MLPTKRISWCGRVATPLACSHRCCLTRCHACPLTAGSSEPSYHSTPSGTAGGLQVPHRHGPLFRRQASVSGCVHPRRSSASGASDLSAFGRLPGGLATLGPSGGWQPWDTWLSAAESGGSVFSKVATSYIWRGWQPWGSSQHQGPSLLTLSDLIPSFAFARSRVLLEIPAEVPSATTSIAGTGPPAKASRRNSAASSRGARSSS